MVESLLHAVQEMVAGGLAAVGSGVGQAITSAVRDRLSGTDGGREALRTLDERPDDPAALAAVRTLLQAELETDPAFAERLRMLLAQPSPEAIRVTTGSITLEGTTLRGRNTFSLGPVSINNTHSVRVSLVAAALVLAAVVALGVYGGTRLFGRADGADHTGQPAGAIPSASAGPSRSGPAPHEGEPVVTALPASALLAVLPAPEDVEPRWAFHSPPSSMPTPQNSSGQVATVFVFYRLGSARDVTAFFRLTSHTGISAARQTFPDAVYMARQTDAPPSSSTLPQWTTKVLASPGIGDESWLGLSSAPDGPDGDRMSLLARVGAVTVHVNVRNIGRRPSEPGYGAVTAEDVVQLGRLLALRAEQAQNGERSSTQLGRG
ncbi:hypothetical protein [Streptomyces sp. NPDC101206]|uniref:hypothetical protein n=1 Tax=Streptomyces sp. NPDC101206 TaxID=3366128 RepID=UPI00380938A0